MQAFTQLYVASPNCVSPAMREMLLAVFSSILITKLCEDTNQKLRARESRANAFKIMNRFSVWSTPTEAGIMSSYEREEIAPTGHMSLPRLSDYGQLFERQHSANKEDPLKLKAIMGQQNWPAFSAQSQKGTYGEQQLLLYMHERSLWAAATEAWRSSLLPRGEVVCEMRTKTLFFVALVQEHAALGWAMEFFGSKRAGLSQDGECKWLHCLYFDEFKVCRTQVSLGELRCQSMLIRSGPTESPQPPPP